MSLSILIFVILFIITCVLAALEMALSSANRIRIKTKAENGDKKAIRILQMIEKYEESITTIIVANNIINIILPTISTIIFIELIPHSNELGAVYSTIFMTITLLTFGEILPKTFGKRNAERVLEIFIGFITFLVKVLKPITFLFIKLTMFVNKKVFPASREEELEVEDEILTMIEESSQEGLITQNEGELIRNAIEFNDIRVDEILQPKNNVFMLDINQTHTEFLKAISEKKYSRIPIFENNTDNIVGTLSERDFFREYVKNPNFKIRDIIRKVDFIPDTMRISKLLGRMQKDHSHMSIVVDEYGTVQGIITVEDILEELVGEIWDEHDVEIKEYQKISEDCYRMLGELDIEDFNVLFPENKIYTETEDSTIAGYILEKIERIPKMNEVIEDEHYKFKILKIEGPKIKEIEVKKK